jgi:hypothetical protein
VNVFQTISIVSREEAQAPIAAKLAAFKKHKDVLLNKLRDEYECGSRAGLFDEAKSWRDLSQLAQSFFWFEMNRKKVPISGAERSKRLRQLAAALRRARGLTDRAMKDELGNFLYRAYCSTKDIGPYSEVTIEKDGSSALTRLLDEMKEMATALTKLEAIAHTAAANDKPDKGGRPTLLPRDCIQGLARVYRSSTGSKPGRGAGPFADFATEFATAVGKADFSQRSLIDAIQDAHRRFKPSWFDREPPQS